jgi:membrane protease YdiL (CAAX protease family)
MPLSRPAEPTEDQPGGVRSPDPHRLRVPTFVAGFFGLWILAWLGHHQVDSMLRLSAHPNADTAYWLTAKTLVWLLYPVLYWRSDIASRRFSIGLERAALKRGLLWGAAAATVWIAWSTGLLLLTNSHRTPGSDLVALSYVGLLTPIYEELVFRGYLQSALIANGYRIPHANYVVTVLFILVHYVGWAFQGALLTNGLSVYPLSIAVLSLLMGYIRQRSGSLAASITLHMANNLFYYLVGA